MKLFFFLSICFMFFAIPVKSQNQKINFDKKFTINKRDTVSFNNDSLFFVFSHHSHKNYADGSGSVLVCVMSYIINNTVKEDYRTFGEKEPLTWTWNNYLFTIISYNYDESMTMKIVSTSNSE